MNTLKLSLVGLFLALSSGLCYAQIQPDFNSSDMYRRLGLTQGASEDAIKKAHRALVLRHHPDKPGGSEEITKQINAAKDFLLDPKNAGKSQPFTEQRPPSSSAQPFSNGPSAKESLSPAEYALYQKWTEHYEKLIAMYRQQLETDIFSSYPLTAFYMAIETHSGWKLDGTDEKDSIESFRAKSPGHRRAIDDLFDEAWQGALPLDLMGYFHGLEVRKLNRIDILRHFLDQSWLLGYPTDLPYDLIRSMREVTSSNTGTLVALFNLMTRNNKAFDPQSLELLGEKFTELMIFYQENVPKGKAGNPYDECKDWLYPAR